MKKSRLFLLSCVALQACVFADKPTFSVKQKGNTTQISSNQDVVSFSSNFSKEAIAELKKQGCKGLSKLPKGAFEKLVQEQNYIEALKSIWAEDNLTHVISTLEPYAKEGHAIIMLELSRTFCRKMATEKSYPEESLKTAFQWYALGLHITHLDIDCNQDPSTEGAYGMLRQVYHPSHYIPQDLINKMLPPIFRQTIKDYKLSSNLPSPGWVLPHGLAAMRGENKLLPKSQWNDRRAKCLEMALKLIAEAESKKAS